MHLHRRPGGCAGGARDARAVRVLGRRIAGAPPRCDAPVLTEWDDAPAGEGLSVLCPDDEDSYATAFLADPTVCAQFVLDRYRDDGAASFIAQQPAPCAYIAGLEASKTRSGIGSRLLRVLLDELDRRAVARTYLHAVPSGGLSQKDLMRFYGRFGFASRVDVQQRSRAAVAPLMVR